MSISLNTEALGQSSPAPDEVYPGGDAAPADVPVSFAYDEQEIPPLRDPYSVEPVDALSIAPDPGVMGPMYIGARTKYADGMTLACATPIMSYEDIKAIYAERCNEPGFKEDAEKQVAFFEEFFRIEQSDDDLLDEFIANPGQDVDAYTLAIREKFVLPVKDKSGFDVWLPYPRSVAGAVRFRHSFLWDGYHMFKGYIADGRWDLALNVLDNTEYQINKFGYPLNGSADFYATRAQPDYFAHEVRALADRIGPEALVRYLPALEKLHMDYWMDGVEELSALPDDGAPHEHRTLIRIPLGEGKFAFLNRYWDDADGPRLESYKEDVDLGELVTRGLAGAVKERRLQKLYKDLRAGAASGWDFSSRWFADGSNLTTINTTDILPVDLNSLLAYNEETLALAYEAAAETEGYELDRDACLARAAMYRDMYDRRVAAINKLLWDPEAKIYRDYNWAEGHQTEIVSAAMAYPLYVGIANAEQTFGVMEAIQRDLLYMGGIIATTTENSKEQWDGGKPGGKRSKNVWAPVNWAAVRGFARMAHKLVAAEVMTEAEVEPLLAFAEQIKKNYMNGIEIVFEAEHIVPEKHRGDNPAQLANGGEYSLVKVLAMPSETYRAMLKLNPRDRADHLTMGRLALAA